MILNCVAIPSNSCDGLRIRNTRYHEFLREIPYEGKLIKVCVRISTEYTIDDDFDFDYDNYEETQL